MIAKKKGATAKKAAKKRTTRKKYAKKKPTTKYGWLNPGGGHGAGEGP